MSEAQPDHSRKRRLWWLLPTGALVWLDLWSKALWKYPEPGRAGEVITVVEKWIYIRTTYNKGAVWSLDLPSTLLLTATALAVPLLAAWLFWPRRVSWWESLGKMLVLSGAVGNLYDRFLFPGVRDFIDVCFGDVEGWHWPTFNVADIALVVGIGLLLLCSFRERPKGAAA